MMKFCYYTEDSEKKLITKQEFSVDDTMLEKLKNDICKEEEPYYYSGRCRYEYEMEMKHYCTSIKNDDGYNELETDAYIVRASFLKNLSALIWIIISFLNSIKKEEICNCEKAINALLKAYDELNNGTVEKSKKRIIELELKADEIIKSHESGKNVNDVNSDSFNDKTKTLKDIREEAERLKSFDSELEGYYMAVKNCISTKTYTISIDTAMRVQGFFEDDEDVINNYKSDKVRKISIFNRNK